MNYGQIYGEIQANGFGTQMQPRCKLWANQAMHMICSAHRWSWLAQSVTFPTVASQQNYNLTGASPIVPDYAGGGIVLSQGGKMIRVPPSLFDNITAAAPTATAQDSALYCIRGGGTVANTPGTVVSGNNIVLAVWPATTGVRTYTLRYWRGTDSIEMVADTDTPIIPVRHHWAVVVLATRIGLSADDQAIQSSIYDQMVQEIVNQMLALDAAMYGTDSENLNLDDQPVMPNKVPPGPQLQVPWPEAEVSG